MGASVVAGGDAPPVFELAEHVLDLVALPVQVLVVWDRSLAVGSRWDAGRDAACGQRMPEPVSVISSVREHGLCGRQGLHHQGQAPLI